MISIRGTDGLWDLARGLGFGGFAAGVVVSENTARVGLGLRIGLAIGERSRGASEWSIR